MATSITNYTDTDKVRAALGVDSADVSDAVLVNMQLALELIVDLDAWAPNHANFTATSLSLLQLYASAFCAWKALDGRQLLYPFLFKDGKAETRRFTIDLDNLIASLAKRAADFKTRLAASESLTLANSITGSTYIMGSAKPDVDPVVGA